MGNRGIKVVIERIKEETPRKQREFAALLLKMLEVKIKTHGFRKNELLYFQWENSDMAELLAQEVPTFRIVSINSYKAVCNEWVNDYKAVCNEWDTTEVEPVLSVTVMQLVDQLKEISRKCGVKIELINEKPSI